MRNCFHKIHLWISIPFGIIISILCLTGALLVFENEIKEFCVPSLYRTSKASGSPLPIDELMPIVRRQLPDSVVISSIQIMADTKRNYQISIAGQGRTSLFVDPYTGEIKGTVNVYAKDSFFSWVRRAHRWFFFPYHKGEFSWGKIVTGTTTLVFVFILISGVVIWIPRSVKNFKTRLKICTDKSCFRFWYDSHVAGGIYAALLLLLMSLTALTFSFDWYKKGFYKVFGVEMISSPQKQSNKEEVIATQNRSGQRPSNKIREKRPKGNASELKKTANYAAWTTVLNNLKQTYNNYRSITIEDGLAKVSVGNMGNIRGTDNFKFHSYTGKITEIKLYKDEHQAAKMRGWIYSLHVGTWGGIITKILYFIACVIGTILPWTGYYICLKKIKNRKKYALTNNIP